MEYDYVALIVDDNTEYREFLSDTLRETGYFKFVIEATNGLEAINKFNKQDFHLVVLDLHMPKLDGVEFLKKAQTRIKDRKKEINSKIIISSAHITEETIKESLELGVNIFLTKPFCPDTFLDKVKGLLKDK